MIFTHMVNELSSLPGISKNIAKKLAIYFFRTKIGIDNLIDSLNEFKNIRECKECHNISINDKCDICLDKDREKVLIVVESPLDIEKFEINNDVKTYYHVLGGLISVKKKKEEIKLNINSLKKRAGKYNEVILALSPNMEGIVTSNWIKKEINHNNITQLARGIPLGSSLEYIDSSSLLSSLKNRGGIK